MPILHVQVAVQQQSPDGRVTTLPPSIGLALQGPCVQVSLGLAKVFAEQLLQHGQKIPTPVAGMALIDTGASCTCIDETAAQQLGLPVIDVVNIASASHSSHPQNVYPAQLELIGTPINIDASRAVGAPLAGMGLLVLIGRDVLQHGLFVYNGVVGELTLAIG